MIKVERDICFMCGQDVERTMDGDRFCNKCGWLDDFDENKGAPFKGRLR